MSFKKNDRFVRGSNHQNIRVAHHRRRVDWIGDGGKTFEQICKPPSEYLDQPRRNLHPRVHLQYDIDRGFVVKASDFKAVDFVVKALQDLGGTADLNEIYKKVNTYRSTPNPSIRKIIYQHSSECDVYDPSNNDLFFAPQGKGKGIWALRKYKGNKKAITYKRKARVSYSKLRVGKTYTRAELDLVLGVNKFKGTREGKVYLKDATFLFVTLDKSNKPATYNYNDYFDGNYFHWESQIRQGINSPAIQKMIKGRVKVFLMARTNDKIKSKTQPFTFCGKLQYFDHDKKTLKPAKIIFNVVSYKSSATGSLYDVYAWSPKDLGLKSSPVVTKKKKKVFSGQGYSYDSKERKLVEMHAMKKAENHYKKKKFSVEDTSSNHQQSEFLKD